MQERDIILTTPDGELPVFVVQPDGAAVCPPVIFYMDALGIREELREMARRIAAQGYLCLLPDLYYRSGLHRFDFRRGNAPLLPVARALLGQLTTARVTSDTEAMLAWIDGEATAAPGPVGCVGHCMSGQFVTTVMARFPQRMAAGVSMYGTALVTDAADSPHRLLPLVRGELHYAFGGRDDMIPAPVREALRQALDGAGTVYTWTVFPDAGHGFAFPQRPAYDATAAESSWATLFDLFRRTLHPHQPDPA